MSPGTIVRLPDGREGTTVYNFFDGVGVAWGRIDLPEDEAKWPEHEAMLRNSYPHAIEVGLECVGEEYEVIRRTHYDDGVTPRYVYGDGWDGEQCGGEDYCF